jgi:hypothetical protein
MLFNVALSLEEIFAGAGGFGVAALTGAALTIALLLSLGIYVYAALVWMTIARKLGYKHAWLAWIPIANIFLLPILAKKYWTWGFLLFVPIVNFVFGVIWLWKIYERRKYPGALSLIMLAPLVPILSGVGLIANLVVMGLVAWKDL